MTLKNLPKEHSFSFLTRHFLHSYIESPLGLAKNTQQAYTQALQIFCLWVSKQIGRKEIYINDITERLIREFLDYLEKERKNTIQTRNARLGMLKSFFTMCQTFAVDKDTKETCKELAQFPKKKERKSTLVDYYKHKEVISIINAVDRTTPIGFRDFTILNLLYNTALRATEVCQLKINYFNSEDRLLEVIGKGNKQRTVTLWPKNVHLLNLYIKNARTKPKPIYQDFLFLNQRGENLTRFGINKMCKKYNSRVSHLKKRFVHTRRSPVHSWRHTAAIFMFIQGYSMTEVQMQLGHSKGDTTSHYLKLALTHKRDNIEAMVTYTKQKIRFPIYKPVDWTNPEHIMTHLSSP